MQCHRIVSSIKFGEKSVASLRKMVREATKEQLLEIDDIVSQLLRMGR